MQAEADLVFHLIETEFQKLTLPKQKELLQSLIAKLGMAGTEKAAPGASESVLPQGRVLGLHEGQGWISDDFNDELPDEFWGDRG
ncbi:MAG: DUF2281 domain-containing protein [Blastocatellia bacterium]